jgi:hypothetical protein
MRLVHNNKETTNINFILAKQFIFIPSKLVVYTMKNASSYGSSKTCQRHQIPVHGNSAVNTTNNTTWTCLLGARDVKLIQSEARCQHFAPKGV